MLYVSPDTIQLLKIQQARAEALEQRRAAVAIRKPGRKLHCDRFNRLVDAVAVILRAGRPTLFEYEAACRHGLRVSLIREGWAWSDADMNAAEVVQSGLLVLGAERPSWDEGQAGFGNTHRVERYGCARCGRVIDDSRKHRGTPAKYCSTSCGNSAHLEKSRLSGERTTLAEYLSACALKSEATIKERSGDCERCGAPFITNRRDKRFCSASCATSNLRKREAKPCDHCHKIFRPRLTRGHEAKFCSNTCRNASRSITIDPRNCAACGVLFTPPHKKGQTCCSFRCASEQKRKARPESTCATCKSVFRWKWPSSPETYCSKPCNPRSPSYAGRSGFTCVEVD